jgi:hypothetical protein
VSTTQEKTVPSQPNLNFTAIAQPLDSLLVALENKIEREWPAHLTSVPGARELFLLTLKTANATYRSIRWLCADKPADPNRSLEHCVAVPPLNRTILDNLFTTVFILEDLPARCQWYFKAEWREIRLILDRHETEYANMPEWHEWLARAAKHSDFGIAACSLTKEEVASPLSIPRWPNPGSMVNYRISSKSQLPPIRAFLKYLNDWFYADLSQQSHLGGGGLGKRAGGLLLDYRRNSEVENQLKRYKNSQVGQTVALVLALASELEAYFNFGFRERARYVWGVTAPYIGAAKEPYEKRYLSLLE